MAVLDMTMGPSDGPGNSPALTREVQSQTSPPPYGLRTRSDRERQGPEVTLDPGVGFRPPSAPPGPLESNLVPTLACSPAKDTQMLGMGLNLQAIASYEQRMGQRGYEISSELFPNSIVSQVKEPGGSVTKIETSWRDESEKYEFKTVLSDATRRNTETSLSLAPKPDGLNVTLSTNTKDGGGSDVVKHHSDANFSCDNGVRKLELGSTERLPINHPTQLLLTNVWENKGVSNTLKNNKREVLAQFNGQFKSNGWGWLPGQAWTKLETK